MKTSTFEKVDPKYDLSTYFRFRHPAWPGTVVEICDYWHQYAELPFNYKGKDWIYDTLVQYQKRFGVVNSQTPTPPATALRMAEIAVWAFPHNQPILDACCGTGMLIWALLEKGVHSKMIFGFDACADMMHIFHIRYLQISHWSCQFQEYNFNFPYIISNPPYEVAECTRFLSWLARIQKKGDRAVLLLPKGFIDKKSPHTIAESTSQYIILLREEMIEKFATSTSRAEIIVLQHR